MTVEKQLLSIPDVCAATGLGESLVKRLIRERRLLSVKVFDRRLVPASALKTFVDQLISEAVGEHQ